MKRTRLERARGVATLESAAIFAVTLPLVLGAAAVFDAAQISGALEASLSQRISESGAAVYSDSGSGFAVDRAAVVGAFERVLDNVQADLCRAVNESCTDSTGYFIEISLLEADIDPDTGTWTGGIEIASTHRRGGASYMALPTVTEAALPSLRNATGAPSRYAVPLGARVMEGGFLPTAPVVVARASVDLHLSFAGNILDRLGVSPVVTSVKIRSVRAEIGS
jgi:hypothetical protein